MALAALALAAWELSWLRRGFQPSFPDDLWNWSRYRERASNGDPRTVALLGRSVMQAAVDPALFARASGEPAPLHLGITGSSPLPVLEDLAADEGFVGVAVCEYDPGMLYNPSGMGEVLPRDFLVRHRQARASPANAIERRIRKLIQGRAVSRLSMLSPGKLLRRALADRRPRANRLRVRSDRSLVFRYDYVEAKVAPGALAVARTPPQFPSEAQRRETLARIARASERIRARGGDVAFLQISCDGPHRAVIESLYAPDLYWEAIAASSGAILLDSADMRELPRLRCPDGLHLDHESQRHFTRALERLLRERLPPRRGSREGAASAKR